MIIYLNSVPGNDFFFFVSEFRPRNKKNSNKCNVIFLIIRKHTITQVGKREIEVGSTFNNIAFGTLNLQLSARDQNPILICVVYLRTVQQSVNHFSLIRFFLCKKFFFVYI